MWMTTVLSFAKMAITCNRMPALCYINMYHTCILHERINLTQCLYTYILKLIITGVLNVVTTLLMIYFAHMD